MGYAFNLTVEALRKNGLSEQKVKEVLQSLSRELADMPINEKFLEENIKSVLAQIYMPTHLEGYGYWIDAIRICKKNGKPKMMHLYQQVAEIHHSKENRVERAMRFAKISAFQACQSQTIKEFFGKEEFGKAGDFDIKNSEFLSILLEKV